MAVKRWRITPGFRRHFTRRRRPTLPAHLSDRFRQVPEAGLDAIRESPQQHYFTSPRVPSGYLETEWGRRDLENHLTHRLKQDRGRVIPWLDDVRPLRGSKVYLERCWRSAVGRVARRWQWPS